MWPGLRITGAREVEGLYEAGEAKLDSRQHRVERDQARAVSVDVRGHEVSATAAIGDPARRSLGCSEASEVSEIKAR